MTRARARRATVSDEPADAEHQRGHGGSSLVRREPGARRIGKDRGDRADPASHLREWPTSPVGTLQKSSSRVA
jgi:hypothetical protein